MIGENPRLLELRRRVQEDPASIAFAQLAEEYRRAGATEEAVAAARAGLAFHPGYLSARVTLGRALFELDRLDEAETELTQVLRSAADNLAANRALAEVYQKRGQLPEALAQYRRALELAKYDPDLESQVSRIETDLAPPSAPVTTAPAAKVVEDLFDFDTLLEQLGGRTQSALKYEPPAIVQPIAPAPSAVQSVELREDDSDPFSVLERQLRDSDQDQQMLAALEAWLSAIAVDRDHRPNA